uniref:AH domain-containing protein n=1 Tax=Ditylenchus dipsaci TaxID=166011 RepID=A0A915DM74_9BILA
MTSFYESKTNGLNFDRFADDLPSSSTSSLNSAESAIAKMRQHFWTAKQVLRQKSVGGGGKKLGDFLQMEANGEKEHLGRVMRVSAEGLKAVSKHRQKTIRPLIRLYHDLDVFNERAVADCASTVEAAERLRMEYRGSLLWIKDTSQELDPNSSTAMDKFRTAQAVVRQNKEKFDKLKEDTLQKVDLLTQSRSQLLAELAREYATSLLHFYENTSRAYEAVAQSDQMNSIDTYEIDILKILNDPVGLAIEKQKEHKRLVEEQRHKRKQIKEQRRREKRAGEESCEDEANMVELDEIEVGQVVSDVPAQQPLPFINDWDDEGLDNSLRGRRLLHSKGEDGMENIDLDSQPHHQRSPAKHLGGKSHPKSSSEGFFRVESPLGILDDSKFEEEEKNDEGNQQIKAKPSSPLMNFGDEGELEEKNISEDLMSVDLGASTLPSISAEPFGIPSTIIPILL